MTSKPTIGIPYGAHSMDTTGYYVECPECGYRFYGKGRSEDSITKSAGLEYAIHYEKTHDEDAT